jgi:hypothetical protein
LRFNHYAPGLEFVTVGEKHLKVWDANTLQSANGLFGAKGARHFMTC